MKRFFVLFGLVCILFAFSSCGNDGIVVTLKYLNKNGKYTSVKIKNFENGEKLSERIDSNSDIFDNDDKQKYEEAISDVVLEKEYLYGAGDDRVNFAAGDTLKWKGWQKDKQGESDSASWSLSDSLEKDITVYAVYEAVAFFGAEVVPVLNISSDNITRDGEYIQVVGVDDTERNKTFNAVLSISNANLKNNLAINVSEMVTFVDTSDGDKPTSFDIVQDSEDSNKLNFTASFTEKEVEDHDTVVNGTIRISIKKDDLLPLKDNDVFKNDFVILDIPYSITYKGTLEAKWLSAINYLLREETQSDLNVMNSLISKDGSDGIEDNLNLPESDFVFVLNTETTDYDGKNTGKIISYVAPTWTYQKTENGRNFTIYSGTYGDYKEKISDAFYPAEYVKYVYDGTSYYATKEAKDEDGAVASNSEKELNSWYYTRKGVKKVWDVSSSASSAYSRLSDLLQKIKNHSANANFNVETNSYDMAGILYLEEDNFKTIVDEINTPVLLTFEDEAPSTAKITRTVNISVKFDDGERICEIISDVVNKENEHYYLMMYAGFGAKKKNIAYENDFQYTVEGLFQSSLDEFMDSLYDKKQLESKWKKAIDYIFNIENPVTMSNRLNNILYNTVETNEKNLKLTSSNALKLSTAASNYTGDKVGNIVIYITPQWYYQTTENKYNFSLFSGYYSDYTTKVSDVFYPAYQVQYSIGDKTYTAAKERKESSDATASNSKRIIDTWYYRPDFNSSETRIWSSSSNSDSLYDWLKNLLQKIKDYSSKAVFNEDTNYYDMTGILYYEKDEFEGVFDEVQTELFLTFDEKAPSTAKIQRPVKISVKFDDNDRICEIKSKVVNNEDEQYYLRMFIEFGHRDFCIDYLDNVTCEVDDLPESSLDEMLN